MADKTILIFPAGMPRSLEYLESALTQRIRVIGSSSLGYDPAAVHYPEWIHLPYISESEFDNALRLAIKKFNINAVFSPNPAVWSYLQKYISVKFFGIELINESPIAREVAPYNKALQLCTETQEAPLSFASSISPKCLASPLDITAIFHHSENIPGMCNHQKIHAMCEIFRYAPLGDVVEIGSWWGKSAFIMLRLSILYRTGKLLCVDPWSSTHLPQNDENGLLDSININADEALTIFKINLLPYANGALNYLRLASEQAVDAYQRNRLVTTNDFGTTEYNGRIAVLHIDGNHSFECVQADVELWSSFVLPGGWIIIDDYTWPYGDGPQRAADNFIKRNFEKIKTTFVMGGVIFLKLSNNNTTKPKKSPQAI